MRSFLPLALILSTGAANAQDRCYTARDLGRGLEIGFSAGDIQTLQRNRDGVIVRSEITAGLAPISFYGPYAIYIYEEVTFDNGVPIESDRLKIAFEDDVNSLPAPASGVTWEGRTTNIFSDGGERAEIFSVRYGEATTLFLSGCSYDMIPAEVRYEWPDQAGGLSLTYHYLPVLGAAYLLASRNDGDNLASTPAVSMSLMSK